MFQLGDGTKGRRRVDLTAPLASASPHAPVPLSSHLATKNLSGGFEILVQLIAQLAMWLRLRLSTQPAVGIKVSPCGLSYGGSHVQ